MWFSLDRRERPERARRRPSHATVVAYLALIVAVLGSTGAAVAAGLIHTRNIADGAVTNPKIRNNAVGTHKIRENAIGPARLMNGAVTNPKLRNDSVGAAKIRNNAVTNPKIADNAVGTAKIRNNAVTGAKVGNNTLTGRNIDESTLTVTRTVQRITGGALDITATQWEHADPYPLTNSTYSQPAHTRDVLHGTFAVHFPAACTGWRSANIELFENGRFVGGGRLGDFAEGTAAETVHGLITGQLYPDFNPTAQTRTLTAQVIGWCENEAGTVFPRLRSALVHVTRFQ